MAKIQKKPTRGGARPGAGRPAQGKVRITVTIDQDVAEALPAAGVSQAVNAALRQALLKPSA